MPWRTTEYVVGSGFGCVVGKLVISQSDRVPNLAYKKQTSAR